MFRFRLILNAIVFSGLMMLYSCRQDQSGSSSSANTSPANATNTNKNQTTSKTSTGNTGTSSSSSSSSTSDSTSNFLQNLLNGGFGGNSSSGGSSDSSGDSSNPDAIVYTTSQSVPFTTGRLNALEKPLPGYFFDGSLIDKFFHCPGDSFLIGLNATFDPESEDREFKAVCQSFQTADGQPVKKTQCLTTSKPYNTPGLLEANFACTSDNMYLAGFQSDWNELPKDRLFKFECCSMTTFDNKVVKFTDPASGTAQDLLCNTRITSDSVQLNQNLASLVNEQVNTARQTLSFQCQGDTVLKSITSMYMDGKNDRRYSFRCCPLSL